MAKSTAKSNKMSVHFSSVNMNMETPPRFYRKLNKEFQFTLDAAANKGNALCRNYISKKENALEVDWAKRSKGGAVFCNPPYGRGLRRWVLKGMSEGERIIVVMLIPARPGTKWFNVAANFGKIRFVTGRLKFRYKKKFIRHRDKKSGKMKISSAPFPSMVVVFGPKVKPTMCMYY